MVAITSFNEVTKSRIYCLKDLPKIQKALIIGGGTGNDLIALLKEGKVQEIVCMDKSEKMIATTQKKLDNFSQSKKHVHTSTSIKLLREAFEDHSGKNYDLIICNYFLDLFTPTEVDFYIKKIKSILKKDGIFICTDFHLYNFSGIKKIVFNILEFSLLRFFTLTSNLSVKKITDYQYIISSNNFKKHKSKTFFFGSIESALWKIFKD